MELMLIVWLVSIISNLPKLIVIILGILSAIWFACILGASTEYDDKRKAERYAYCREKLFRWKTGLALLVALAVIPNESTMKYMAGAYLLQTTYQSDFVQQAIPLSQKAVLNQLNRWAEDSTELKNLLLENQNAGEKGN